MINQIKTTLSWILLLFLFIFLLIIILVFLSAGSNTNTILNNNKENPILKEFYKQKHYQNTEGKNIDNFSTENKNPKITIVEFYDFSCPFCYNSYSNLRKISTKYQKYVKIIYRDIVEHKNSLDLSMLGHCANEQNLFLPMHDYIFQNNGNINIKDIPKITNQLGINTKKFQTCFNNKKYQKTIAQNMTDAKKLEVKGTPTLFINGYKIEGDIPYETLIKLVEAIINN